MGYVRKPKIYKLTWADDTEYAGLEVRARGAQLGTLLELMTLATQVRDTRDAESGVEVVKSLLTGFAAVLVSWNLEEPVDEDDLDGEARPVPATLDGLKSQDLPLVMTVIEEWIEAVSGTPGDLGKGSSSGGTSPGGSPTTEASLAALSSSLAPS